jgi:outer membrane biogenesis lipoprotein LolB
MAAREGKAMKTTSILIAACALLAGCAGQKHLEIQRVKSSIITQQQHLTRVLQMQDLAM